MVYQWGVWCRVRLNAPTVEGGERDRTGRIAQWVSRVCVVRWWTLNSGQSEAKIINTNKSQFHYRSNYQFCFFRHYKLGNDS